MLERDVEHRDKRLEVLTRKFYQLENRTENQAQALSQVKIHETPRMQASTTENDISNLIGKPIILKQQWKGWRLYRPMNGLAEKTRRKPVNRVAKRSNKNMQGQGRGTSPKNGGAQEKMKTQNQAAQGESPKNGQAKIKPGETQPGVQPTEMGNQAVKLPAIEGVPSYGQGQLYCSPAQQAMLQQVIWNCLSTMVQRELLPLNQKEFL